MLKELRVTEIIGCKRQLWFNNAGYPRDLTHPIAHAGTELHTAIDNNLKDNIIPTDWKYDNEQKFNNFLLIKETLKIDYLTAEERYYSKRFKPVITGKPDLILHNTLYDWKSGKLHRIGHELQLTGYYLLLKDNGIDIDKMCIVYLGNPYPVTNWFVPDARKIKIFLKNYDDCFEVMALPKPPYSELIEKADFGCLFCNYFTACKTEYYK